MDKVQPVEEQEPGFVTLEELCGEDVERDQETRPLERYGGKLIRFRTRVPLQVIISAQKRYMSGKRKDSEGFMVALLKYLLLEPRVTTKAEVDMLRQADGKLMLDIINTAVGNVSDLQEDAEDEAGE